MSEKITVSSDNEEVDQLALVIKMVEAGLGGRFYQKRSLILNFRITTSNLYNRLKWNKDLNLALHCGALILNKLAKLSHQYYQLSKKT